MSGLIRRRVLFATLLIFTAVISTASAQEFAKPLQKLELNDGDCIVFLGDSITHQCLYTQYVENYFYTKFPGKRFRFHNAGVGGATAWDALQRFDKDVAAYKPKYVTVLLGMNDGRYQPFNKEIFETYRKDMTEVIARIKKIGATPILMTPTMFDSRAARMRKGRKTPPETLAQYNGVLAYYGAWLREVATDNGYGFVDMYQRLNSLTLAARKGDPKFTVIADAVHPGPDGQLVMAYSILRDLTPPTAMSSIVVARQSTGKFVGTAGGGKIATIKNMGEGLEFEFTGTHLPWIMPDEAKKGNAMLRIPVQINREIFQVLGMPRGHYELSIDGEVIGTFSHTQLFRGLQLHNSKKTPQYLQSLKIATLNKQRNDGPVKSLRNEWRTFQQFARLERQLKEKPGDEKLKKQVADLKKKLEGMDERIKKHEQAAKEIEDKIHDAAKVKTQKYKLAKKTLASARGMLKLDGKPLAGATISFSNSDGVVSAGMTDVAGGFVMQTGGLLGVPTGEYRVVISKLQPDPTQAAKQLIPKKYSDAERTALTVNVKDGENNIDFDLASR